MKKKIAPENSLTKKNPKLAKEWHPTKNKELSPDSVTPGTNIKVWWKCDKGHEWQARIGNRVYLGRNCPYCVNQAIGDDNNLAVINPKLIKEWHPTKNGKLLPNQVPPGTNRKVWWRCKNGHEWKASIAGRTKGIGCPYCSHKAVCEDNCLATLNPELASEWNYEKNINLTPNDVTVYTHKKVWWRCKNGHEWEAIIANRANGNGCPCCSGQKACKDNCLANIYPEIAKEWNIEKNGNLTPEKITAGSNKKVWWKCEKGHEWETTVSKRTNMGRNCPYCSNQKVCKDNCLATLEPKLAKEWHPTKNGDLTPDKVTSRSGKRVWWQCEKGHEWQSTIANKAYGYGKCPKCQKELREWAYTKKGLSSVSFRYK